MSFFPYTATVGNTFLRMTDADGEEGAVVGVDGVSSMGGDYPNMRQLGYKVGVRAPPAHIHRRAYHEIAPIMSPHIACSRVCFSCVTGVPQGFLHPRAAASRH